MYEICSKLIIETPEQRHRLRSGIFVNLTYFTHCSGVAIVDLEQANADLGGNFNKMCLDISSLLLTFQLQENV